MCNVLRCHVAKLCVHIQRRRGRSHTYGTVSLLSARCWPAYKLYPQYHGKLSPYESSGFQNVHGFIFISEL